MERTKNYLILLLFLTIIVLLLLKDCGNKPTKPITLIKSDTITVIKSDTIWQKKEVVKYLSTTPTTFTITKIKRDSSACNILNTYEDSLKDSIVVIKSKQIARGELISSRLSYKLLIPERITKTVLNTINNTYIDTIYRPYCYSIYVGLTIGGNTSTLSTIQPFIGVRYKTTYMNYGYNLVNSTHNVGVAINLFNIK